MIVSPAQLVMPADAVEHHLAGLSDVEHAQAGEHVVVAGLAATIGRGEVSLVCAAGGQSQLVERLPDQIQQCLGRVSLQQVAGTRHRPDGFEAQYLGAVHRSCSEG